MNAPHPGPLPEGEGAEAASLPHGHGLSQSPGTIRNVKAVWRLAEPDPVRTAALAREAGVTERVSALLLARGVGTAEEAARFLCPDISLLHDPMSLEGIAESAELLVHAARSGRRIVVFGDYDVDGVTAVAQLKASLLRAGADAVAYLPHRLRDGYGLKPETVRNVLRDLHPAVIVTVDCGITAVEGVACARAAGVEVVVTDHHLVPEELPQGAVVVNPKRPGSRYPEKELAASGIAMKLAQVIARRAQISLSQESLLRAACLGTIADLVPLKGENRVIAAMGLAALAYPRALGLKALLAECGVPAGRAPTSEEVAFRIAPRLNAAGRLDTAELALSLFEERDPHRAAAAARELSLRNAERQRIERRIVEEARLRIEESFDPEAHAVIVEADAAWHRGVLGIAAARLAREYHRPVLLFGLEGGRACGSGRSVPGVSLHETLKPIAHLFEEFGGHDQAVGGSLPAHRVAELREAAREIFARQIPRERRIPIAQAEALLPIEEASTELAAAFSRLEPHGMGNPRPVFLAESVRATGPWRALGENGARGRLSGRQMRGAELDAICWRRPDLEELWSGGAPFDIHYRLGSGWRGQLEVEILEARSSGALLPLPPGEGRGEGRPTADAPEGAGG